MSTRLPFDVEPTAEAHESGDTYDVVQRWAFGVLFEQPRLAADTTALTVSFTRGHDGRWHGHIYAWPDLPAGPNVDPPPYIEHRDAPAQPLYLTAPTVDLGTIASGGLRHDRPQEWTKVAEGPGGVAYVAPVGTPGEALPVVPGLYDPFPSATRAAADAETARYRAAIAHLAEETAMPAPEVDRAVRELAEHFDRASAPLELDLNTEAPKPKRETRRAKRERLRREAAEAEVQTAFDAADRMARASAAASVNAQPLTVPPSGHRPDSDGVEPVTYPLCTSRIDTPDGAQQCKRTHRPGAAGLVHTSGGYLWRDDDTRIIRSTD